MNKDIPDGSVAAGIPCKVIGSFEEYKKKIETKVSEEENTINGKN